MTEINPTQGDTLEERLRQFEEKERNWYQEKRGMITDLQTEREKRHGLENRIAEIETTLSSPGNNGDLDPEKIVNEFVKDPDGYIDMRVEAKVKDVEQRLLASQHQANINEAYGWIAEEMGTTPAKFRGSNDDQEIGRIVKEYGLGEIDPRVGVRSAHKIYLQEKKEKEEREKNREEVIVGNTTERVRSSTTTATPRFTRSQISAMDRDEFNKNYDLIKEAQTKGLISND